MKKIFSIIIPTYNVEDKITKSVKSIINQNHDLYECIIVDGNSDDNTIELVKKHQNQYPDNIKYISETDQGVYDAMNRGIDLAEGEYLYFLGAGDTLKPNILTKVKEKLKMKSELVYGGVYLEKTGQVDIAKFDQYRISNRNISHQAIFYHNSIFRIIGKYNLNYPILADYEFNIRCFSNEKIEKRYLNLVIANYEEEGISSTVIDKNFIENKSKILLNFLGATIKDVINKINYNIKGKKIIIWGTSAGYKDNRNLIKGDILCFIDSDKNKQGDSLDDKKIYSPDKLFDYNKEDIFIIVFSKTYYNEISDYLQEKGFKEFKNYCCFVSLMFDN
ncbi:glycosyltransferase family 2 protein [Orenia marismortui]|uniref:Glycosyltransferase involved in cell wall biosynthesis n=1 Tax=Orenia marismortui TaxID=46469 RepID=A0A4R8HKY9_9FIRM|nr:glycosyltransferase family 2 protein [Orenia marismortui]TDX58924.1 glycosyltransferase involved in cell wall biosynthesis [Orenia marismortui]